MITIVMYATDRSWILSLLNKFTGLTRFRMYVKESCQKKNWQYLKFKRKNMQKKTFCQRVVEPRICPFSLWHLSLWRGQEIGNYDVELVLGVIWWWDDPPLYWHIYLDLSFPASTWLQWGLEEPWGRFLSLNPYSVVKCRPPSAALLLLLLLVLLLHLCTCWTNFCFPEQQRWKAVAAFASSISCWQRSCPVAGLQRRKRPGSRRSGRPSRFFLPTIQFYLCWFWFNLTAF